MISSATLRPLLVKAAWLVLAALVAFGSAGVVAAMQHVPGSPERAELTYTGDLAARPALDAAAAELQALSDDVDRLGSTARQTLAAVVGGDVDGLQGLIAAGTAQIAAVDRQAAALEAAVSAVPGVSDADALSVSVDIRRRHDALLATSGLTSSLQGEWSAFIGRALDAASLTNLLARHDIETAAAAKEGAAAHYAAALKLLDIPDATIAEARALAERLGQAAALPTLATWIDRNASYDAALRDLYSSLLKANGRVTDQVRAAFEAEKAARALLPPDDRGMVVIMAEVAQGGLNQAVIAIEEVRGSLAAALDAQAGPEASPADPG